MNPESISLESLEDQVRALSVADTPAEVFKALLESARLAAPRASVYLVRQGQTKGWGAVGYPPEAAARQRAYLGPADAGWLGEIVQSEPPLSASGAAGLIPDFGQPQPLECVGIAVRLKGRAIALIVAERQEGEYPWFPPLLSVLVRVSQLRLDLDLARRKLSSGRPTTPPAPAPAPAPAPRERPIETAPPAAVTAAVPGAAQAAAPAALAAAESAEIGTIAVTEVPDEAPAPSDEAANDPHLEAARRYARLVATDIRLYNEEAVLLGRKNGDLAERLKESLVRGRETFLRRHSDLGTAGTRILHDAYVQVLAAGQADLLPSTVLDGA